MVATVGEQNINDEVRRNTTCSASMKFLTVGDDRTKSMEGPERFGKRVSIIEGVPLCTACCTRSMTWRSPRNGRIVRGFACSAQVKTPKVTKTTANYRLA